jgi:hypothetical protein
MSEHILEQRISTLEKEIAELKVQISERPTFDIREIAKEILTLQSSQVRGIGITG